MCYPHVPRKAHLGPSAYVVCRLSHDFSLGRGPSGLCTCLGTRLESCACVWFLGRSQPGCQKLSLGSLNSTCSRLTSVVRSRTIGVTLLTITADVACLTGRSHPALFGDLRDAHSCIAARLHTFSHRSLSRCEKLHSHHKSPTAKLQDAAQLLERAVRHGSNGATERGSKGGSGRLRDHGAVSGMAIAAVRSLKSLSWSIRSPSDPPHGFTTRLYPFTCAGW